MADPVSLTKSAFGELLAHTGTDPQPYAFTGEPYDPNSGFQYHRARWMDPRRGLFLALDLAEPVDAAPASLHRYSYVLGNPVNERDPSGRLPDWLTRLPVGQAAHAAISIYYALLGATIDVAISETNKKRPDIRFHNDVNKNGFFVPAGEVYEIKTRFGYGEGVRKLLGVYVPGLRIADPGINWRPGTAINPQPPVWPRFVISPLVQHKVMMTELQPDGVIVYWFNDADAGEDLTLLDANLLIGLMVVTGFVVLGGQVGLAGATRAAF